MLNDHGKHRISWTDVTDVVTDVCDRCCAEALKARFVQCISNSTDVAPVLKVMTDTFGGKGQTTKKKEFLSHLIATDDISNHLATFTGSVASFPKKTQVMPFIKSAEFWEMLKQFPSGSIDGTTAMAFLVAIHVDGKRSGPVMTALYSKFVLDQLSEPAVPRATAAHRATPAPSPHKPKRTAQDYKELAFQMRLLKRRCDQLDKDLAQMGQCAVAAMPAIQAIQPMAITDGSDD